jgi:outer membrane protein assembly factor BamA
MLTLKTPTLIVIALFVLAGPKCYAQAAFAESSIIYSTGEARELSDTTHLFTIKEIVIEGNKKTKDKIILRELSFGLDEQYPLNVLIAKFQMAKVQLLNTTLFETVTVSLVSLEKDGASVLVSVKERWYFFPMPFADVVDNSLQEWSKHMDFNRINYGVKLKHKNISGLNDRLYLDLVNGYTKGVSLRYEGL